MWPKSSSGKSAAISSMARPQSPESHTASALSASTTTGTCPNSGPSTSLAVRMARWNGETTMSSGRRPRSPRRRGNHESCAAASMPSSDSSTSQSIGSTKPSCALSTFILLLACRMKRTSFSPRDSASAARCATSCQVVAAAMETSTTAS
eukprot:Amastigsp_a343858_5.p4 type:complete len:150 gc:universal Amastigsp_a343858_5:465-16(-)